jgi:sporulation protein YlmC with PRC-barrel domain
MKGAKVHLEHLVGREVHDSEGKRMGRILSVTAERQGGECVVQDFLLGPAALLRRLGISTLHMVGFRLQKPLAVPWDQLDLSDPQRPCLRCRADELKGGKKDRNLTRRLPS